MPSPRLWIIAFCTTACGGGGASHSPDGPNAHDAASDGLHDDGGGLLAQCTPTNGRPALIEIETSGSSTCALYADGHVACWGRATYGALGDGQATHTACGPDDCSVTPVRVSALTDATAIAGGGDVGCALHHGGTVSCWGDGSSAALGDGVATHESCKGFDCSRVPVTVSGLTDAIDVSVSVRLACALRSGGGVVCWGANDLGQLGDGVATHDSCKVGVNAPYDCSRVPVVVSGLTDAVELSVGADSACARRAGGSVVCWGAGTTGQLGDGATINQSTPVAVGGLTDAIAIRVAFDAACALRSGGGVVCWGRDDSGMLGDGSATHQSCPAAADCSPTPVAVTAIADATAIAGQWDHACAIRATGAVECWGDNSHSELGDGATHADCGGTCSKSPVTVAGVTSPVSLSASAFVSCAMQQDCAAACWGFNAYGQLGDGTMTDRATATAVVGL